MQWTQGKSNLRFNVKRLPHTRSAHLTHRHAASNWFLKRSQCNFPNHFLCPFAFSTCSRETQCAEKRPRMTNISRGKRRSTPSLKRPKGKKITLARFIPPCKTLPALYDSTTSLKKCLLPWKGVRTRPWTISQCNSTYRNRPANTTARQVNTSRRRHRINTLGQWPISSKHKITQGEPRESG
jgi:hypothetical protein